MSWVKTATDEKITALIDAAIRAHKWAMTESEIQQVIPWLEDIESALKSLGVAPWEQEGSEAKIEVAKNEPKYLSEDLKSK